MAYNKILWLVAAYLTVLAAVSALPAPRSQENVGVPVSPVRPLEASEKTDLKAEGSYGFGYGYGPYGYGGPYYGGGWGGYGGYGYGYGYPYGYAYGYPYAGGWGYFP